MAHTKKEIETIKDFIESNPTAKIFLGVDSQRMKKKRVKFATVVIIHYQENGTGKGAKIFTDVMYEDVRDNNLGRPFNRMMKEVSLVTELYHQLEDVLIDKEFAIHLDVNPVEGTGSNVAYGAAKGMIWGMVGIEPVCKPDAWAASCAADRYSK